MSKLTSHDLWGKIQARPENKNSFNITIVTNALHRNWFDRNSMAIH